MKTEVVALRDDDGDECFRVFVDGKITTPQFASRGAAQAYAAGIESGYRKPEFRT